MNIDYKAIGVRIKAARARKGVTQGYIAEVTGLSTPHISNIETGNTKLACLRLFIWLMFWMFP